MQADAVPAEAKAEESIEAGDQVPPDVANAAGMTLDEALALFELDQQLAPFEDEHFAAERQIADERLDEAHIGQMMQDEELVAINNAILLSLQDASVMDGEDSSDIWSFGSGNEDVEMPEAINGQGAADDDVEMSDISSLSQEVDGPAAAVVVISNDE